MRKKWVVGATVLGGLRGPKIGDAMVPEWIPDEAGIYKEVRRAQPIYEYQTRKFGDEVTPEEFAHNGPDEFERLLSIGAVREELTEEPGMTMKPQPPPAKSRGVEALAGR